MTAFTEASQQDAGAKVAGPPRPKGKILSLGVKVGEDENFATLVAKISEIGEIVSLNIGPDYSSLDY